jgi:hypothetical protein
LARRLVEKGVRFVCPVSGGGTGNLQWDAHDDVEKPAHFRNIHTTILNQLGLDQDALSYLHQGREERLTEIHGSVIAELV